MIEQIYQDKSSEIFNKLKEDGKDLIKLLDKKKIKAIDLAILKPEELNPKIRIDFEKRRNS